MTHEHADSPRAAPLDPDNVSSAASLARRSVDPYRDPDGARLARRRALALELEEAERAAARRARIEHELRGIDEDLAPSDPLDDIEIDAPCRARWEAMRGDGAIRRCTHCDREVYDLAGLTRAEIRSVFERLPRTPCARVRRHPDGRVVTADRRPRTLARAAALAFVSVLAAGTTAAAVIAWAPVMAGASPPRYVEPILPRAADPGAPDVRLSALRSTPESVPSIEDVTMGEPSYRLAPVPEWAPTRVEIDDGVRAIAEQVWEIDRRLLERAHRTATYRTNRIIPHEENGRVVGVKVYGIRRDSLLGRLGIQNGDMIVSVNDAPTASPDAALEMYSQLYTTDALFVRLDRRGEDRVHVYRIVG